MNLRQIRLRLALVLNVLRGRPVAYRLLLVNGVLTVTGNNTMIVECQIKGDGSNHQQSTWVPPRVAQRVAAWVVRRASDYLARSGGPGRPSIRIAGDGDASSEAPVEHRWERT